MFALGRPQIVLGSPRNQCSFVYPYPSVSDFAGGNSDHVSTALLLNEVSEKSHEIWDEVSENFSEICSEIRPEILRAFLAGKTVLTPNFTGFFPSEISNSNRIPNQISPNISQTHFCRLGRPKTMVQAKLRPKVRPKLRYCIYPGKENLRPWSKFLERDNPRPWVQKNGRI